MTIENDPSARMQLRSRGELRHPGACCICGNGTNDDGYVDLGVFYDYEGTMYLDMTCALQIATLIGCVSPEEIKIFEKKVEELAKKNDELRKDLDDAQHHVDTVNALLRSKLLPSSDSSGTSVEISEAKPESEQPAPTGNDQLVRGRKTTKPVITEPTPFA